MELLSGEKIAAFRELKRRGSLSPEQVSAFDELQRRSLDPVALKHQHNLNLGQSAETDPVSMEGVELPGVGTVPTPEMTFHPSVASRFIAEPVRGISAIGANPAVMAFGETAAQEIEKAGGARKELNPVEIGAQAAIPAAIGVAGKVVGQLGGTAADALKSSAMKQYSKVLAPTTKENKLLTERVVPELLDRRVRAATRSGLAAKAEGGAETAAQELETAYARLPQDAQVNFVPVLNQIQKAKDKLIVKGTNEIVDQDLHKALDKVQQKVLKIAGGAEDVSPKLPTASVETTRSARQAFDTVVSKETKIFGKTGKETAKLEAQKEAGNAIRAELAQEYPDVAKINKEFNLWKNVEDVLDDTRIRTASHATPLGERMITGAGVVGGLTKGVGKAALYGTGLKLLSKAVNSTAWRTVSAVEKNRLADLLASGKSAEAEIYLAKILGRTATLPSVDGHNE